MARPFKISEYQIKQAIEQDLLTPKEICERHNCVENAVYSTMRRHGIKNGYQQFSLRLPGRVRTIFDAEAAKRQMTVREMTVLLMRNIARDNLFTAVLDSDD